MIVSEIGTRIAVAPGHRAVTATIATRETAPIAMMIGPAIQIDVASGLVSEIGTETETRTAIDIATGPVIVLEPPLLPLPVST